MLSHQENCMVFGYRVPHYFWFMLSGALCDVVQAFIDYGVYLIYVLQWEKATVCWAVSYTLSIVVRHFSHRLLGTVYLAFAFLSSSFSFTYLLISLPFLLFNAHDML